MRERPRGHAALVGGAVALAVATAFPWWSGRTGGAFGTVPWWARLLLLGAAALLAGGQVVPHVGRRWTAVAALVAGSAAVAGVVFTLAWSRSREIADGRGQDEAAAADNAWWWGADDRELHAVLTAWPHAALTAVSLAAVPVAAAALVLALRWRPWLDLTAPPDAVRARLRGLVAYGTAGVLAGGLLSVGAVEGAERITRARTEALGPWWSRYADSTPVPADRLHQGSRKADVRDAGPGAPERPGRVAWRRGFAGPAALSVCRYEGRERGTLVVLEENGRSARVTGRDPRDGSRRWTFTLRGSERVGLRQVAVSEGCSVLVLAGSMLIGLDAYTGRERGATVLPIPGRDGWRFITPYRQPEEPPKMVTLPDAAQAHLASYTAGAVAVRRDGVETLAQGPPRGEGCSYLVDYAGQDDPGTLLMERCAARDAVVELPERHEDNGFPPGGPDYRTPELPLLFSSGEVALTRPPGCAEGRIDRIRADGTATVVSGQWRCGKRPTHAERRVAPNDPVTARPDWRLVPAAEAPLRPAITVKYGVAEAVGDSVRFGWGLRSGAWAGRVVPRRGDRLVALDGPLGRAGHRDTLLALGASGLLTAMRVRADDVGSAKDPEPRIGLRTTGSTSLARVACPGTRDLLTDTSSATALVVCREGEERTRVVAVADGKGFEPRS